MKNLKNKDNTKDTVEEVSLFQQLKYISQKQCLPLVVRFIKVNLFFIVFECLLTVYTLELYAIMSKNFIVDVFSIPTLLVMIVIPFFLELIVCILFGTFFIKYFVKTTYEFLIEIYIKKTNLTNYQEIEKKYDYKLMVGHVNGVLCYAITTMFLPMYFSNVYQGRFYCQEQFILRICELGTLLGIFWNISGYYRNKRILWYNLFPQIKTYNSKIKENNSNKDGNDYKYKILDNNFNYLISNFYFNLGGMLIIILIGGITLFNLHPDILKKEMISKLLTDYNFLFVVFIGLISFYVKKTYSLIYSFDKKNNETVFPGLIDLLDEYSIDEEKMRLKEEKEQDNHKKKNGIFSILLDLIKN